MSHRTRKEQDRPDPRIGVTKVLPRVTCFSQTALPTGNKPGSREGHFRVKPLIAAGLVLQGPFLWLPNGVLSLQLYTALSFV